jgi:Lon protease-like protein
MVLSLPLFPLTTVLFPGAPMPLHIFEPRYRQMLADCLSDDRRFGLIPDVDPAPGGVGCVADIRASHSLPDGRSNIVVLGDVRFELIGLEESSHPYLVGTVETFADGAASAPSSAAVTALRELAGHYRTVLRVLSDSGEEPVEWSEDAERFSFQVSALLQAPLPTLVRLLATRSTATRVNLLLESLPPVLQDLGERAELHVRARQNGKGGPHHDLTVEA